MIYWIYCILWNPEKSINSHKIKELHINEDNTDYKYKKIISIDGIKEPTIESQKESIKEPIKESMNEPIKESPYNNWN